jgi:DNA-binding transcriptional ArsR family regulator
MSSTRSASAVDDLLFALADPTRRALFEAVVGEPGVTTSALCDQTKSMTRWGVIKHMAVLRDAGLIQTMATGRLRRHYAERSALVSLREWLDQVSR